MSSLPEEIPLAERLDAVRASIADAARASGRSPEELTTIVVTKFHPVELIRELSALGVMDIGENRHQEAQRKAHELADLPLRWHFVGQLQSKKAKQVREYAHVIHSVDRSSLVTALGSETDSIDCFIQVNLTDDHGRGGAAEDALEPFAEHVLATPGLRLRGVMAVAPLDSPPRAAFARLRGISERLRRLAPDARAISAGMSNDFPAAIAEGATHLRIGTAITGKRPDPG